MTGLSVLIALLLAQQPAFEVASIKPAAPATRGGRASTSGDRIEYRNTTLSNILMRAFERKLRPQVAGPPWIFTERYDIVAKAPENTPKEQIPAMLRTLLIERFELTLHREIRELPVYALVAGKGPLKMQPAVDTGEKNSWSMTNGRREAKAMSMPGFAQFLSLSRDFSVIDDTGLTGFYDFPFELSAEERGQTGVTTLDDASPSIFTIVQRLGLKLEPRRVAMEVIMIDSGNKVPRENE